MTKDLTQGNLIKNIITLLHSHFHFYCLIFYRHSMVWQIYLLLDNTMVHPLSRAFPLVHNSCIWLLSCSSADLWALLL